MTALRCLCCVLLGGLFLVPPAAADEADALARCEEADDAMDEKSYAAAAALYREAIEAHPVFVPAHAGLGEALLAAGETQPAIVAFRGAVRAAAKTDDPPKRWRRAETSARRRLKGLDPVGAELDAIIGAHVKSLTVLARRHAKSDPDLTERALRVALTLRPDDEGAGKLATSLANRGTRREALFDGKQIADWDGGRSDWWQVDGGLIKADTGGIASYIRTQDVVEGDHDVVMEARMVEALDDTPFFALMGAWQAEFDHSRFGILDGSLVWYEKHGEDDSDTLFKKNVRDLRKRIDPEAWNVFEIRYRGDEMSIAVNGKTLHTAERPAERAGGFVGILAQGCKLEVSRVEVVRR